MIRFWPHVAARASLAQEQLQKGAPLHPGLQPLRIRAARGSSHAILEASEAIPCHSIQASCRLARAWVAGKRQRCGCCDTGSVSAPSTDLQCHRAHGGHTHRNGSGPAWTTSLPGQTEGPTEAEAATVRAGLAIVPCSTWHLLRSTRECRIRILYVQCVMPHVEAKPESTRRLTPGTQLHHHCMVPQIRGGSMGPHRSHDRCAGSCRGAHEAGVIVPNVLSKPALVRIPRHGLRRTHVRECRSDANDAWHCRWRRMFEVRCLRQHRLCIQASMQARHEFTPHCETRT